MLRFRESRSTRTTISPLIAERFAANEAAKGRAVSRAKRAAKRRKKKITRKKTKRGVVPGIWTPLFYGNSRARGGGREMKKHGRWLTHLSQIDVFIACGRAEIFNGRPCKYLPASCAFDRRIGRIVDRRVAPKFRCIESESSAEISAQAKTELKLSLVNGTSSSLCTCVHK